MALPSVPVAADERERRAYATALCRQHAGPLLALASIILDDVDTASEIVAATVAAACRPMQHPQPARVVLARSVYRRCVGQIAAVERFGPSPTQTPPRPVEAGPWLAALSANHRAVMALTLFGGHDLRQVSLTLRMPTPEVVRHLRETILYCTSASEPAARQLNAI